MAKSLKPRLDMIADFFELDGIELSWPQKVSESIRAARSFLWMSWAPRGMLVSVVLSRKSVFAAGLTLCSVSVPRNHDAKTKESRSPV